MISTLDPRLSPRVRAELHRLLKPGECVRRPKRPALPRPEELRREYLALVVELGSGRKACRKLARSYACHPESIRRRVCRMPQT